MPHYRINIQLENDTMKEFVINDLRKDIDLVYFDFKRRTYDKNGAGRVIYFDLVMIADESIKHLEERMEVLYPENNFGIINTPPADIKFSKKKREYSNVSLTLAERQKNRYFFYTDCCNDQSAKVMHLWYFLSVSVNYFYYLKFKF